MSVVMKFYNKVDPRLQAYIKHYWITLGALEEQASSKILPMDHIDMVVPLIGDYSVIYGNKEINGQSKVFFHGIREIPLDVIRHDYVECFGISFKTWGFYPFVNKPLSDYQKRSVFLEKENEALAAKILDAVKSIETLSEEGSVEALIKHIENILLDYLNRVDISAYEEQVPLLRELCQADEDQIDLIADHHHMSVRTLERLFNKYIGVPPRTLYKIRQFESASRAVLFDEEASLTEIAYDSDYYDQAHFSKKFKKYTKESPKKIRKNKSALKSHMTFK